MVASGIVVVVEVDVDGASAATDAPVDKGWACVVVVAVYGT